MKNCPNCGVGEISKTYDYCYYPETKDPAEITRFLARQSIKKVSLTDFKRISKISGTVLSALAVVKILFTLFLMIKFSIPFIFWLFLMPTLYLILGIISIRFPIPGISIAVVIYLVDNYIRYTSGIYVGSFFGVLFSLAFLAVLIVGLVNGIKYEILKKNNPYLYSLITNDKQDDDLLN